MIRLKDSCEISISEHVEKFFVVTHNLKKPDSSTYLIKEKITANGMSINTLRVVETISNRTHLSANRIFLEFFAIRRISDSLNAHPQGRGKACAFALKCVPGILSSSLKILHSKDENVYIDISPKPWVLNEIFGNSHCKEPTGLIDVSMINAKFGASHGT
jgi:hypothetical protein